MVTRSGRSSRSASHSGSGGRTPQAASTASGNLAAWAVPSTTIGTDGSRVSFSAHRHPHRGVRVDEVSGLPQHGADGGGGLLLVGAIGGEDAREFPRARAPKAQTGRDCASERHQRAHRPAVAAIGLEQQPLEIRRHLDVHRGRGGRHHLAQLIAAGCDRAGENVVDVGGDHQAVDRQAHAQRDITGIDVAEIARRHGESDLAVRRTERDRGR